MRSRLVVLLSAVLMTVLAFAGSGVASAAAGGRDAFVAQARAAGLTAVQADGLQGKVDAYLAKLGGKAKQISPNQVDLGGAVLNVTVPGEDHPRPLGDATTNDYNTIACIPYADYGWFCAYQYEFAEGDNIGMYTCGLYSMPWATTGSWINNQTEGTRPTAYFTNQPPWLMPPAYANQYDGVNWKPVTGIRNC